MPASTTTTRIELESAQRLRQVIARLYRRLRITDATAAAGLTPARASALLNVDRQGPMRLSELSEREGLNPTMLSRMVGDLVDAGLMERTCDASDRRAAWVKVTRAGAGLAMRMRAERTRAVNQALEGLAPDDAEVVVAALPALERLVEQLGQDRR